MPRKPNVVVPSAVSSTPKPPVEKPKVKSEKDMQAERVKILSEREKNRIPKHGGRGYTVVSQRLEDECNARLRELNIALQEHHELLS